MRTIQSEKGMSLVSVLLAIGLTGILATILMKLSQQHFQLQKKVKVDTDMTEIINHLNVILTKKMSCNATFMGKKKDQQILRLLKDTDPDNPPYAVVSDTDPFRKSSLFLTGMKVLTDQEVQALNRPLEQGIVIIQADFRRAGNVIGGNTVRKIFELPVVYGREELIYHPLSESGVVSLCKSTHGPQSFIKSLKTGERAEPEESGVYPRSVGYEGMCVIPDPLGATTADSTINHCLTVN